jgi:hypothetical protein
MAAKNKTIRIHMQARGSVQDPDASPFHGIFAIVAKSSR